MVIQYQDPNTLWKEAAGQTYYRLEERWQIPTSQYYITKSILIQIDFLLYAIFTYTQQHWFLQMRGTVVLYITLYYITCINTDREPRGFDFLLIVLLFKFVL